MRRTLLACALAAGPALADGGPLDPAAIAVLAETCRICHGPQGRGAGEIKAIAGRAPQDLAPLLRDLRDGRVPSSLMVLLLAPLTDDELAALAAEIATWN